ncbi:hypothetical protein [Staphylococcus massiliensis]|uniref:Uncharacterized protein n=3 Tax=Bacteria TaxID=2 RepID=S2DH11_INDAL|nr:hypothetical protein [Staphylococcus massiliensis]EKU45031.1 hypothetical protein C273_11797 [Staphylococcus massiliensis S46]EOZ96415.1 hypothetical protein A33Q_2456 [Indibacter alkaliphilus LW1]
MALSNSNLKDIQTKIERVTDKIDTEKIDFGQVIYDEEKQDLVLTKEEDLTKLRRSLNDFEEALLAAQSKIKQQEINKRIISEVKDGGQTAEILSSIFSK